MGFFDFFKKDKKQNFSRNEIIIDLSEKSLLERKKKYNEDVENLWVGKNEIERIREDGYIIYKSKRVTPPEREQVGFYGLKWFSENGKFCVVYLSDFENIDYNLALIDTKTKTILYKKKLIRPKTCRLTNNGVVICNDWGDYNLSSNTIYCIDKFGSVILKKRHNSLVGEIFQLIENESKFKYNLNYSGKIFTIDIE
ncbi:hypothetical protein SDC9_00390 [bioreactor metagenome]|uniref:Uncharacterized protein n=1 Tax=bioreactor metagenome TaxID=1076179 RepID=A0A644SJP8_9ZZZZ